MPKPQITVNAKVTKVFNDLEVGDFYVTVSNGMCNNDLWLKFSATTAIPLYAGVLPLNPEVVLSGLVVRRVKTIRLDLE